MKKIYLPILLAVSLYGTSKEHTLQDMAKSYEIGTNKNFAYVNNLGTAFKYFEFKGYIRAVLDSSNKYKECKKEKKLNEIAKRAAVIISSSKYSKPNSYISSLVAVNIACNVK